MPCGGSPAEIVSGVTPGGSAAGGYRADLDREAPGGLVDATAVEVATNRRRGPLRPGRHTAATDARQPGQGPREALPLESGCRRQRR